MLLTKFQILNKRELRNDKKMNNWRNFAEEIADVEIMIDQIKTVMTWEDLEKRVKTCKYDKLLRLKNMIRETEGERT